MDKCDYRRFLALLYLCNSNKSVEIYRVPQKEIFSSERDKTLADIGAYCLMRNHFHLLMREKQDGGISKFMQKLCTGFTMYFNRRRDRTGALFESRFRAKHLNTDTYLKYAFSYVHLNPMEHIEPKWKEEGVRNKKAAAAYLREYPYSSFPEYVGDSRPESSVLNGDAFPSYFKNHSDFIAELNDWLQREGVGG